MVIGTCLIHRKRVPTNTRFTPIVILRIYSHSDIQQLAVGKATTDAEWFPKKQVTDVSVCKYYGVALTNEAKTLLVKLGKAAG